MSEFEAQGGTYIMDRQGVVDILKSKGVRDELLKCADKLCSEANKLQSARQNHSSYKTNVFTVNFTSISEVYTGDTAAKNDQATYHTLNAINH